MIAVVNTATLSNIRIRVLLVIGLQPRKLRRKVHIMHEEAINIYKNWYEIADKENFLSDLMRV